MESRTLLRTGSSDFFHRFPKQSGTLIRIYPRRINYSLWYRVEKFQTSASDEVSEHTEAAFELLASSSFDEQDQENMTTIRINT